MKYHINHLYLIFKIKQNLNLINQYQKIIITYFINLYFNYNYYFNHKQYQILKINILKIIFFHSLNLLYFN